MNELEQARKGLPDSTGGLPTLNLDRMMGVSIPNDWNVVRVMGDILMCCFEDENDEGLVLRNGIYVQQEAVRSMWRVAKVLMKGPTASNNIQVGDKVMFPSDRGLAMIAHDKKKYVFLNEERVFAVVKHVNDQAPASAP